MLERIICNTSKVNMPVHFIRRRPIKEFRHTPDILALLVHGLMVDWKVLQVIAKIDGKQTVALEETWVPVGRIEVLCI